MRRILRMSCLFLSILVLKREASACSVDIVPSQGEAGFHVIGEGPAGQQITVTGELSIGPLSGQPQTLRQTCSGGRCELFVSTVCVKPFPNKITASAGCGNPNGDPSQNTGSTTSLSFTASAATTTLTAELLDPPTPDGNVKVTYAFPHTTPGRFFIQRNGGTVVVRPTTYEGSFVWNLSPGTHLIESFAHCFDFKSLTITVPATTTEYQLRITNSTPGVATYTEAQRIQPGKAVKAKIALGTVVDIKVVRKKGFLDPLFTIDSRYSVNTSNVTPAPVGKTLFPSDVLLRFGADVVQQSVSFQAVHLGTTSIAILPFLTELPPFPLEITVVKPTSLGHSENQHDSSFISVAHDRGLPPQYIKGQALQESPNGRNIRVDGFRYEPCSWDVGSISTGAKLITKDPYHDFVLDDDIGTTLVPNVPDDLDPRNRYFIQDGTDPKTGKPFYRRLTDADRDVKMLAIWDANDSINSKMNWSQVKCRNIDTILKNRAAVDFIAQTPTASSYGIFQVMYGTAIDAEWPGARVDPNNPNVRSKAPKYLFDRPAYVDIEGGSMRLGTAIDVKNYGKLQASKRVCGVVTAYPSVLATHTEFESFLTLAFQAYNCFHIDKAKKPIYGPGVMKKSINQAPVQPQASFFQ